MTDGSTPEITSDRGRITPLRAADLRLASNMTASLVVPTATSFRELDVSRLVAERARFNAALAPRKLSLTHFLAYALAQAAAVHPALAAHYEEHDGEPFKVEPKTIALGLAVDVVRPDGNRLLLVPVLRAAETLDFEAFTAGYDDLVARARILRLAPDEMQGPDLTLTNPGLLGTYASVPRLLPGQGAIVAAGVLRTGDAGARLMVSCTYDHRIITGAQSALFLATLEEFLAGADGFYEDAAAALGVSVSAPLPVPIASSTPTPPSGIDRRAIAAAAELLDAWRAFGHRAAHLDPLGSPPPGDPALEPATYGLDAPTLAAIDATAFETGRPGESAAAVLADLQRVYGGTIAYEFEHLGRHEERAWLREAVEHDAYATPPLTAVEQARLLARLSEVEAFEQFLGRAYLGQTRFSLEGLDSLVPLLDTVAELAAGSGIEALIIGMAHRGRLNVLAHLVEVPYSDIIADFAADHDETLTNPGEPSDVRYHRGAAGVHATADGPIAVSVLPNPSHLEAIDPVLLGTVRAQQTDRTNPAGTRDLSAALAVMVHGDASFAGQGVVAETFNLARLPGYTVGGALHIIANNQIGFTTPPEAGRSTAYASDLAKGFDVPVVHVNADDPEAVLTAARLGFAYRARFGDDFLIDLVGYRRLGHNEGDEPAYTQPAMYAAIAALPTVRARYAERLVEAGVLSAERAEALRTTALARLAEAAEHIAPPTDAVAEPAAQPAAVRTAVMGEQLIRLDSALYATRQVSPFIPSSLPSSNVVG